MEKFLQNAEKQRDAEDDEDEDAERDSDEEDSGEQPFLCPKGLHAVRMQYTYSQLYGFPVIVCVHVKEV